MSVTFGGFTLLRRQDFATTAFICNGANLLETTVFKATSLTGNGSSANPLAVKISANPGNDITFGGDGGIFFNETITTLSGNNATSQFTYTNEAAAATTLRRVSVDAGNGIGIGTDGGAFISSSSVGGTFLTQTWAATVGVTFANTQPIAVYPGNVLTLTINNPSATKTLTGIATIQGSGDFRSRTGGNYNYGIQQAALFVGPYAFVNIPRIGANVILDYTIVDDIVSTFSIAPAGSVTRFFRFALQTLISPGAGVNSLTNARIRAGAFIGGTV